MTKKLKKLVKIGKKEGVKSLFSSHLGAFFKFAL